MLTGGLAKQNISVNGTPYVVCSEITSNCIRTPMEPQRTPSHVLLQRRAVVTIRRTQYDHRQLGEVVDLIYDP